MDSFFQRIGAWLVACWGLAIIVFLFYIWQNINGIARMLVYYAGG